jgi:nitroreductase
MSSLVRAGPRGGPDAHTAPGARYDNLMDVLRDRVTTRAFDQSFSMPRAHIEQVMDAAAQAPSGANAQPWHYVAVTTPQTKRLIAQHVVAEQMRRAMTRDAQTTQAAPRLHCIDYAAMGHAPGFIVVVLDPRMTWAFPGLMEGSELDQPYHANSERLLLQSVAASTMAAHLAATALGYQTWWVSALGYDEARAAIGRELGIPGDLQITDFFLFGPSLSPPAPRWKKTRPQILSWDHFDMANFRSVEQIDEWISELRDQRALEAPTRKQVK